MQALRALICLVLFAALLPLGGYLRAAQVGEGAALTRDLELSVVTVRVAEVSPAKRCRIMHLSGSQCGPDVVAHDTEMTAHPFAVSLFFRPQADWRGSGRTHAPPREPPRNV